MQQGLDEAQACLAAEDWPGAERHLSEYFVKGGDDVTLERALILQAHAVTKTRLMDAFVVRRKTAQRTIAEPAEQHLVEMLPLLDTPSDVAELASFSNGLIPLRKALRLAQASSSATAILNVSLSFIKISRRAMFKHAAPSIVFLRDLVSAMQAIPGDNSENILAWRTVCHLLLARFILSEEITETPSKRGVDEARANVLQASQLSYESPTARYLFLQGLRVLISLSSKVVDLIEPRWSSVPAIKALVLLDKLRVSSVSGVEPDQSLLDALQAICSEMAAAASPSFGSAARPGAAPQVAEHMPNVVFVSDDHVRLMLAREAIGHGLFALAADLLARCRKHASDVRMTARRDLLEAEASLWLHEEQSGGPVVQTLARINTLQNISRVVDVASENCIDEVVLEACITTWNLSQPILEDANRHLLVAFMRNACKAIEALDANHGSLEFFLQHELAKCYETMNLLSLAETHAAKATEREILQEYKDENSIASKRIVAKLHSLSSSLRSEIKALTLVDRSRTGGSISEANHFLQQALKAIVPGFEQRNFANKIAGKIDAAPKVRDAELFLIVMAEIMREALRRVENRGLFNQVGSGFDEIAETSQSGANLEIADAWEVVFVSSSFVIDACAADPSRKRLLAEASLSKGQSIAQGILIFSDRPEAYKRLETAAASFLSALEIGKTLSERWIVFNSAASLWNTFVAAEQCFAHSADPRRGDRPGEMWTEVFQKLADLLADTDICDSTLYSQICSTLGLSLVEAQAAQTADSLKSKGKPVGKDGATLLKAAEDMFKSGLGAKHADYNSLFVGAKGWCKLQSQRQPPAVSAQSLESDDPVLRLFVALETGQFAAAGATAAARQSKDADIAASEHAASALHHVKLMPDIFRAELFLRIARQSAELGSHGVALGCARSASAFLGRLEQYVEAGQAHYWLLSCKLFAVQMSSANVHVVLGSQKYATAEALSALSGLIKEFSRSKSRNATLLRLCLRHVWNTIAPNLTRKRSSLVLRQLVSMLKCMSTEAAKNEAFRQVVNSLDPPDLDIARDLFLAAVDILIDEGKLANALRLADMGMRFLAARNQADLWFRKALVLNAMGRGSSLVPLKDSSIELQAQTWERLAAALPQLDRKIDALQMAAKLLSSKHLTDTWAFTSVQFALGEALPQLEGEATGFVPRAGLDAVADLRFGERSYDFVILGLKSLLSSAQAADVPRRRQMLQAARNIVCTLLMPIFLNCKPPVEADKEPTPSGKNSSAPKSRKPKEPAQDVIEMPSNDKWHLFCWPAYICTQFQQSAALEFINKSNIHDPLEVCAVLLHLVRGLVQSDDLDSTHAVFCLLELVSDLACTDAPDVFTTVLLYSAVVLTLQGHDKRAREKYRQAMLRAQCHREEHQLSLPAKDFSQPPKTFKALTNFYLIKAECHLFFRDFADAHKVLAQCKWLSTFLSDSSALCFSYSLESLACIGSRNYDSARFLAAMAIRLDTRAGGACSTARAILPFICAAIAEIGNESSDTIAKSVRQSLSILDTALEMLSRNSDMAATKRSPGDGSLGDLQEIAYSTFCDAAKRAENIRSTPLRLEVYSRALSFFINGACLRPPSARSKQVFDDAFAMILRVDVAALAPESLKHAHAILFVLADRAIHGFLYPPEKAEKTVLQVLDDFLAATAIEPPSDASKKLESSQQEAKHMFDYYLGMHEYIQWMAARDSQDEDGRRLVTSGVKHLYDSIDGLAAASEFEKAQAASEALYEMSKATDPALALRLVIAVQTRRKDAAVAKQDRKKTPSDDSFSDFEIREFDANVLDILVNEYSVMSSTQGDLPALLLKMQQAFDLIFSEFRIEENVSDLPATPSAAESQRPKSIPKEDMQPASVDEFQHLYVIPDKAIDILPLEILLSKYFPKVTSVSRDFNIHVLAHRQKNKDVLPKTPVPEPTKKKDKAPEAEKEKPIGPDVFSTPNLTAARQLAETLTEFGQKACGIAAENVSADEFAEIIQRGPAFLYHGPSMLSEDCLGVLADLKLSGRRRRNLDIAAS
ncbi:Cfap46p [Polyrhizophydium stewartii]|uniref:Cfap46p n=1 Tax=Polyrhizophydium stewartii TaxID=2732419 RepID=A0ABR4MVL3_9FUNG